MPAPSCRLIVPIHNGLEYLEPMLRSLGRCTDPSLHELVLSDDASGPEVQGFLEGFKADAFGLPETRIVRSEENRGFAATCNAGAIGAESEFLVFLNTDLEFRPGWLEKLIEAAEDALSPLRERACEPDPERSRRGGRTGVRGVGAVGCKLLYPDGTIQHGGVFLREDRLDRIPLVASHDHVGKPADDPEANRKQDLLAVTAAAILVRREAFEAVGGFDEAYMNGYEDVDLCLKLGREGWRIVYEPACELVHFESKSGAKRFAFSKHNQRRFLEKWHGIVRPEVLVTPWLEVGPHPIWDAENPFDYGQALPEPRVQIVIEAGQSAAALALTLESVFSARIGLYDEVVVVGADSADIHAYLLLCEGHDEAFRWIEDNEIDDEGFDFVVHLKPGTVVTQGWLARLIDCSTREGGAAVGPMLTHVAGPQDALGLLESTGAFSPNELSHAFARRLPRRSIEVRDLLEACRLFPINAKGAHKQVVAQDVFVHLDPGLISSKPHALAA